MHRRIEGEYPAHTRGIWNSRLQEVTCTLTPVGSGGAIQERGQRSGERFPERGDSMCKGPEVRENVLIQGTDSAGVLNLMWRLVRMRLRELLISLPGTPHSYNYKVVYGILRALSVSSTEL